MNDTAVAVADSILLGFPVVKIKRGTFLYHGSRSLEKNAGLRANSMFTTNMGYAADYAFKKESDASYDDNGFKVWETSLNRKIICCTLVEDIYVVSFSGVSWSELCGELHKADSGIPNTDYWVQNNLVHYIIKRYGTHVRGGSLYNGLNNKVDEYIFDNATALVNIHRIID